MSNNEQQYLDLLRNILENGEIRDDRTKVGTLSLFCPQILKLDISESIPLMTTRNLGYKWIIKELLWFIRGETDNKILTDQGVKIWIPNTTKEFMDKYKIPLEENDIGALYGFTLRHWGADYIDCKTDYTGQGFDQLLYAENLIKTDPTSRRIIINHWNPSYFGKQVLTPCHNQIQFYVSKKGLECTLYLRSSDLCCGLPSNIFCYTLLTYIMAKRCGLKPSMLNVVFGDVHIYSNHVEGVRELLKRKPYPSPKIHLNGDIAYKAWEDISVDDFKLVGYQSHPKIQFDMAV